MDTAVQKNHFGRSTKLSKSWSFKESLLALRRNLTTSHNSGTTNSSSSRRDSQITSRTDYQPASKCDVWRALSPPELPDLAVYQIMPIQYLSQQVFASSTGPNTGLAVVKKWDKIKLDKTCDDALKKWCNSENRKAHGLSISLYEKNPLTNKISGQPNADCYVVRARRDSAFLAVADGVNWGRESMRAARTAICAVYAYLETHLYGPEAMNNTIENTRDAAQLLFETFSYAQEQILACTTGLTTLCIGLVLPIWNQNLAQSASPTNPTQFALIVASVGDTQAFLLSKFHGIREVTGWVPYSSVTVNPRRSFQTSGSVVGPNVGPTTNATYGEPPLRDFRDTGGALGGVHKDGSPELNNLICAVTLCDPGDIVILGSDGLTDNFDPVITRLAVPQSPHIDFVDEEDEVVPDRDTEEPDPMMSPISTSPPVRSKPSSGSSSISDLSNSRYVHPSIPARSWYTATPISPPPRIRIWPKPPPAPPVSQLPYGSTASLSNPARIQCYQPVMKCSTQSLSFPNSPIGDICASQINFTNQLELSWPERRSYASKELERVWHELDVQTQFQTETPTGTMSSKDLCQALMDYVTRVTSSRRNLLEDSTLVHLRKSIRPVEYDPNNPDHVQLATQRKWFADMLKHLPGKLDHATVACYEVGVYRGDENEVYEETAHGYNVPKISSPTLVSLAASEP